MTNENGYEFNELSGNFQSYRKVFRVDGKKYATKFYKQSKTRTAKQAMALAEEEYLDIIVELRYKGKVTPKAKAAAKALKFRDAIDVYFEERGKFKKGYKEERFKYNRIKKDIGNKSFVEITDNDIAAYRDELLETLAQPSVRQYLSLISVVYDHYIDKKRTEFSHLKNPTLGVKRPDQSKWSNRIFKGKEKQRLLEAAQQHRKSHLMYPCILFALATSMRRGEIAQMRWEDINFEKKYILIRDSKNDEGRRVPFTQAAREAIDMLDDDYESEAAKVFVDITDDNITKCFREICNAANIKGLKFHNLRHIALTDLADAGLTTIELQRFSGHKTLSQLSRYVHANSASLADKADRLLADA